MLLITGPYQSGKTYELWKRLRAEPPGKAVLVTPHGDVSRDLKQQIHKWTGSGLLPLTIGLKDFFERCAASVGDPIEEIDQARAAHWMSDWCAKGLARTCWESIAGFRATSRDLADLCLRLDQARISDADLQAAALHCADRYVASQIDALLNARQAFKERLRKRHLRTPGERLQAIAASEPAVPWPTIYVDDVMSLTPAEMAVFQSLDARRNLIMTAVDDHRLGDGSMINQLRSSFVHATEQRCDLAKADQGSDMRKVVAQALEAERTIKVAPDAVINYHYRDEAHAGRAIAALMRRRQLQPGKTVLFVRACDAHALALADALIGAGVPVQGTFGLPYAATAEGALVNAIGAWCERPIWRTFLDVCQRLVAVQFEGSSSDRMAPLFLPDLVGPWGNSSVAEVLRKLSSLQDGRGLSDNWGWDGPDDLLKRTVSWLGNWAKTLAAKGAWLDGFTDLVHRHASSERSRRVLAHLAELAEDHVVTRQNLDDALATEPVEVERGQDVDDALLMHDAVRGRATTRDVVVIHDLELGKWPYQPRQGGLFSRDGRNQLMAALGGRDPYEEAARKSGEVASLLAVLARARSQIVIGICCGDRVPSPWLASLSTQLGWDLVAERKMESNEITPGAPLDRGESQGPAERELWQDITAPTFTFKVPVSAAGELGLKASELNDLLQDSFAWVCNQMQCGPSLSDRSSMEVGSQLHALLAGLTKAGKLFSPPDLERAVEDWIRNPPDPVERALRRRHARGLAESIVKEQELFANAPAGWVMLPEQKVEIALSAASGKFKLSGRVDRIDQFHGGQTRIVDYKSGSTSRRDLLNNGVEGQLLAYAIGLRQQGGTVIGAHYRNLRNAQVAGYRAANAWYRFSAASNGYEGVDVAEFDERQKLLIVAIDTLAGGQASTSDNGLCGDYGYAPIARLDEAKLDLDDDGDSAGDE
jgi:RecB family exonuclease